MKAIDFYRQNAVIEPIKRQIFTRRRDTVLDVLTALAIGAGLALALVQWWSA